jgi:MmgE/PrpD C-terminal domain
LRNENKLTADQIERVDLVHPLVLELTGKKTPHEGLEGKFSIYHAGGSAGRRRPGEKQFSDRAVNDPAVVALRSKVIPVVTPGQATRNQVCWSGGGHHSGAHDPAGDG